MRHSFLTSRFPLPCCTVNTHPNDTSPFMGFMLLIFTGGVLYPIHILYACNRIASISAIPIRVYERSTRIAAYSLHDMPIDPIKPYVLDIQCG